VSIVRCGNYDCPVKPNLPDEPSLTREQRTPCPACGSRTREFLVAVSLTAAAVSTSPSETQSATGATAPVRPRLTLLGFDITHEVHVRFSELDEYESDGACVLEVVTAEGEVLVSGVGENAADALAQVFERMLPPSSSEFEPREEDPDE
jgi:hypothetical protein